MSTHEGTTSSIVPRNLLVFGATGVIGKFIIDALIKAKPAFGRIAIFTSPGTIETKAQEIQALKERGVDLIVGDIKDDRQVSDAYNGIDTVISAVGRNVIQDQINLIKLADQSPSVKWFFPSEYGTDIEYGPASASEKPHQAKLKVRAFMKTVKNLEYTYLVTGPYADLYLGANTSAREIGSFDVRKKSAVLLGDGKGRISVTTMSEYAELQNQGKCFKSDEPSDSVGKLLVAALTHPKESRNRALLVNSFTSTPEAILAEFEFQSGGEKWSVSYTSLDKLRSLEEEAWTKGVPTAAVYTLRRIWTEGGTLYDSTENGDIEAPAMDTVRSAVGKAIEAQK